MARRSRGNSVDVARQTLSITKGGTETNKLGEAPAKLKLLTKSMIGQPNGPIAVDGTGKIPLAKFSVGNRVNLEGSLNVIAGQTLSFVISDYDSFKEYVITSSAGSVTRSEENVTFLSPLVAGLVTVTINGKPYTVQVDLPGPLQPAITSPVEASNILSPSYQLTSSAFVEIGDTATHQSTDWQLSADPTFASVFASSIDDTVNKTSWTVSGLSDGLTYYARVRYKATNGNSSLWSPTTMFAVAIPAPIKPSVTSPTANQVDVSPAPVITSSAFVPLGDGSLHANTDWQIATDSLFTNIVSSSLADAANKTSWVSGNLAIITQHFVRVRHRSGNGKVSPWSDTITFTTVNAFVLNKIISASMQNYNMKSDAIASGWDQVLPLQMTVTVNPAVVVGSASTSTAAFDTGTGFPSGSSLALINNHYIAGRGGNGGQGGGDGGGGGSGQAGFAGGPALRAQVPLKVTNNGTIGGGGGGGGGAGPFTFAVYNGSGQVSGYRGVTGGGGGGGAGNSAGSPGRDGDGDGTWLDVNGGSTFTGGAGSLTNGGGGGAGQYSNYGGSGGNLGQNGSASNAGYKAADPGSEDSTGSSAGGPSAINPGGAAGSCVVGSANVTWINNGTRLGPLS